MQKLLVGDVPFYLKFWVKVTVPGSLHMFNRRVPHTLDWQTWRRQLSHTGVDSVFTVKCVANVFALLKRPSTVP